MSGPAALHGAALPHVPGALPLALARMLTSASVLLRRVCAFVSAHVVCAVAMGVCGEYADRA